MFERCSEDGCDNDARVVIRDDMLNGTRYCPSCALDEFMNRQWI